MSKQTLYNKPTRILGILTYLAIVGVGLRALLWTPHHIYSDMQIILLSGAGGITVLGSIICLIAYLAFRWRWEYISVWIVAVGLSGYALISAVTEPPQNIAQLVSLLTTALCLCLMSRGVSLYAFAQRAKEFKE